VLKSVEQLAIGDWVVLESLQVSRFCGKPWKVENLSGSRVYLESYVTDPVSHEIEVSERKYVARKTVKLAFTSEDAAKAVSTKARELSEVHFLTIRQAEKEHQARVAEYIASLPVMVSSPIDRPETKRLKGGIGF
jgi:ABC-type thiamine transport system substrate-binding protein